VVQPPARRAAEGTDAGRLLVEQPEHDDRATVLDGGDEGGVVGDPQVVAQPDDGGALGR
jgi:hypothetical protein